MKRLPLLSLSLVVALGVGCSNSSQESASTPTQQSQVKKRKQALSAVTLQEVPVSADVQAAAGEHATVRAFSVEGTEGEFTADDVVAAAFQQGATEPSERPWQLGAARSKDETRTSLRYMEGLIPAIEAAVGVTEEEQYSTGHYHWFQPASDEVCDLNDVYILPFVEKHLVYVLEARGITEC